MSLYLTQYIDNPLTYRLWPGYVPGHDLSWVWDKYNQWLHTSPRIYDESVSSIKGFFYIPPPKDMFVLWVLGNQTLWPSWYFTSYRFNAQTGELIESVPNLSIWVYAYTNTVEWGDLGHLYSTRNDTTNCFQINWETGASESSQWIIYPYTWTPKRLFSHLLVNKQQDKILGVQYPYLEIWENAANGTPNKLFSQRLSATVSDLAYESNEYGWVLTTNGQILKVDWGSKRRIEMASSLQAYNPTDEGMYLAYDSFRRRLAVYRWMPDAIDGAARNRIEFYETVPKAMILTQPVPVTRHRAGDFVKFKANIIGDTGEGFAGGVSRVSLVAPNNHGRVLSTSIISGIAGDLNMSYQAPNEAATDTIQIAHEPHEDLA